MTGQTAKLTDLTRRIERDNDSTRRLLAENQQLEASPEDAALDQLRKRFGT